MVAFKFQKRTDSRFVTQVFGRNLASMAPQVLGHSKAMENKTVVYPLLYTLVTALRTPYDIDFLAINLL